jgi:hypothetical protein
MVVAAETAPVQAAAAIAAQTEPLETITSSLDAATLIKDEATSPKSLSIAVVRPEETPALDTITNGLDAATLVKAGATSPKALCRVRTTDTCYSVATECNELEERDAVNTLSRGEDEDRDSADDTAQFEAGADPTAETDVDREVLHRAQDEQDGAINHFYSSIELGAARVWHCMTRTSPRVDLPGAEDLLARSIEDDSLKGPPHRNVQSPKTQVTTKSGNLSKETTHSHQTGHSVKSKNYPRRPARQPKPPARKSGFFGSLFGYSGPEGNELDNEPALDGIINDTIDITSDGPHILDTFSDDLTLESMERSLTSKANSLLAEI